MCLESIDTRLLSRAGQVLRALAIWQGNHPGDDHPTVPQLALVGGLDVRTVQRGLADLVELRKIRIEPDLEHPVGRRICTVAPVTTLSPDDRPAAATSTPLRNVERRPEVDINVPRRDDKPVTRSPVHPDLVRPEPPTPGLGSILGIKYGPEFQAKLPTIGATSAGYLKLHQVVGRLDVPDCSEEDRATIINKLAGEYGQSFRPFYGKVVEAIRTGRLPMATIMDAIESAGKSGVMCRGAVFVKVIKLGMESGPTPGQSRQAQPGVGGPTIPDTGNSSRSTG